MPEITFTVNGESVTIDAENDDELLYLLRDRLGITGPKYGCGVGVCGACTIHKDGEAVRPCIVPMAETEGSDLTTIEGLASTPAARAHYSRSGSSPAAPQLHPVQQAWIDEDVAQCGYCQAGQIMTAVKLLERIPQPTDADIDEAMRENVCRCGTYYRIRRAIKRASGQDVGPTQGPVTGTVAGSTDPLNASGLPGTIGDTVGGLVDDVDDLLGGLLGS